MTGLVLLGFVRRDQLGSEVAGSLGVSATLADDLAKAVDESILAPFKRDLDRIYCPPSAVPSNSPYYAYPSDGTEHLRSAYNVITAVTDVSACDLSMEELEQELAKLRRRHGGELRHVQLAWRELALAEELDAEAVIFVSDQKYYDIAAVRSMVRSASTYLNVPVVVQEKRPTPEEERTEAAKSHLRKAFSILREANDHLVKHAAAFRRSYAHGSTVSDTPLRASEPEIRRQVNLAWQEIAAAERLDAHASLGRGGEDDDSSEMDVHGMRELTYGMNGELLMALGAIQQAKDSFELALRIRETDHSHYMLGLICAQLGQRASALAHFRRCIELDPDGSHATDAVGAIDMLHMEQSQNGRPGCLGGLLSIK